LNGKPVEPCPVTANVDSNSMVINSYSFGCMMIDGKQYTKDLIILPDGTILHPWWRKTGHTLAMSDIQDAIATSPDILVVGTGNPGLMKPEGDLCKALETMGIETRVMPTKEATKEYNALRGQGKNVAGCFHLTC
jgi:hypothetical protein